MNMFKKIFSIFKSKDHSQIANSQNLLLPTGRTFQQQVEFDYQQVIDNKKNSPNPKFHRTSKEEELAFDFFYRHASKLEILETAVYVDTQNIFNIYSIDERINQCHKAIESYEKLKKFCLSKGKGGIIHFEDMWEHCHNSKNEDYRYIEQVEKELDYLVKEYEKASLKLLEEKTKKEKKERIKEFKKTADYVLLKVIEENRGILQKDLYKQFNPEYKTTISNTIRKMHESGNIIRIKEGNTFKLYLKNHDH